MRMNKKLLTSMYYSSKTSQLADEESSMILAILRSGAAKMKNLVSILMKDFVTECKYQPKGNLVYHVLGSLHSVGRGVLRQVIENGPIVG